MLIDGKIRVNPFTGSRFNIKTGTLLRSLATDKLSCDIQPRKMIKMVRRVSRDHIIMIINVYSILAGPVFRGMSHIYGPGA